MKQKKTLRFSDSDSSASALKVPESKRCMTKSHNSDRKEETMNTDTNTTTTTDTTATAPKAKAKRTKKTTAKAHTIATCTACATEYKAEAWHTESLCPTCYAKAHPKAEKPESTTAQTVAKVASAIMLAVLITKGTHYAVSVIEPSTGRNVSKVYLLKSHTEALTLAEKMYHDRKLDDILDATREATDTEATIEAEAVAAGE